jgi:hypothetical protein
MKNQTKTIFAIVAIVLAIGLAASVVTSNLAYAVDISCSTHGGGLPPGQQPTCKGKGLTQNLGP